jgi:serine/threonine protein phosphatase 1
MPDNSQNTWLVGDIHGCLNELEALLAKIPGEDKLIFLGDYIDRGPDSKGCVERLMHEKHRSIFLRGNHEQMLLDYFKDQDNPHTALWLHRVNGGPQTLQSYGLEPDCEYSDLPASHRDFIETLPLYHETEDFIAVHAGVNIEITRLDEQAAHDLMYIRMSWISNEASWPGKHVVFGHTPARYLYGRERQHEIIKGEKSTGIDTGCVYGGSLTALNPATREIIQVAAARPYA